MNTIPIRVGHLVVVGLVLASLRTPDISIGVQMFSAKLSFTMTDSLIELSDLVHAHGGQKTSQKHSLAVPTTARPFQPSQR
jgi:hypothetical protein